MFINRSLPATYDRQLSAAAGRVQADGIAAGCRNRNREPLLAELPDRLCKRFVTNWLLNTGACILPVQGAADYVIGS